MKHSNPMFFLTTVKVCRTSSIRDSKFWIWSVAKSEEHWSRNCSTRTDVARTTCRLVATSSSIFCYKWINKTYKLNTTNHVELWRNHTQFVSIQQFDGWITQSRHYSLHHVVYQKFSSAYAINTVHLISNTSNYTFMKNNLCNYLKNMRNKKISIST